MVTIQQAFRFAPETYCVTVTGGKTQGQFQANRSSYIAKRCKPWSMTFSRM